MFSAKKHHFIKYYSENEGEGSVPRESDSIAPKATTPEEPTKSESQKKQDSFRGKQESYLTSQKKVIGLATSLESLADEKVDVVMQTSLYIEIPNHDERKKKVQQTVGEFIARFKPEFDSLKSNLEAIKPPLSKEEIESQLQDQESQAFEQFINLKLKEQTRDKAREKRKQRHLEALVTTGDELQDKKNQELILQFTTDYLATKKKILEEQPELADNKEGLRIAVQKAIDVQFIEYCQQNSIPLSEEFISGQESALQAQDESEGGDEYVRVETQGSVLAVQQEYLDAAEKLSKASELYNEVLEDFDKVEEIKIEDETVYELPRSIIELPPGETTAFVGYTGGIETVYEATREKDGEYSLKFEGVTLIDLKKEDLDIVLSINDIPIINTLFSRDSRLYSLLRNEYGATGKDKFKNPPDGFIEFIYERLNQAYLATLPNGSESFLGIPLPEGTPEEQGRYIRRVLTTNISIRDEAMKRLYSQKIVIGGKINLSLFPI
ncbi:MAG: hypothetical protein HHAS10_03660 [Candidatus Altimarinota bacterium]